MASVEETSARIADGVKSALAAYLPQTAGYSVEVTLYEKGRRKRRNASRDSWNPAHGEIRISFGAPVSPHGTLDSESADQDTLPHSPTYAFDDAPGEAIGSSGKRDLAIGLAGLGSELGGDAVSNASGIDTEVNLPTLIRELDQAENWPGFNFVALKWFRDKWLPRKGFEGYDVADALDDLIREAVADGVVLVSRVDNPKNPQFPVTAIRLDRRHPEVAAALGRPPAAARNFRPIGIRGEPLSETVLRDRR